MLKSFRYSGSKTRLLKYLKYPPSSVKRVVEPYLGSGAYMLNSSLVGVGFEINQELYSLWEGLKKVTPKDLQDLDSLIEQHKKKHGKFNIKDLKLEKWAEVYCRLNICSVVLGQLSSWTVYPKYSLPIKGTIECLPRLKSVTINNTDGSLYAPEKGDLLFIDPPYVGTLGNYKDASSSKNFDFIYEPKSTKELIERLKGVPAIFTYGSNAKEVFPEYNWEVLKVVKVPNIRKGGTVSRTEHVCYINF